ncbi:hypothetical protein L804_02693 [Cryptococcus deuterogattii 2001/935-1]|nr:hypothetical protein L804_02693 [Cryptococcus deuterogattii 2001/935-1]
MLPLYHVTPIRQEGELILKANDYASQWTPLAPQDVKMLAEPIFESSLNVNWISVWDAGQVAEGGKKRTKGNKGKLDWV